MHFSVDPLELVLRGSVVYWFLFLLFRFVLRRDAGSLGIADILLLVLIADASQNAMSGGYETVADGFVLVATLAGWNWLLDWASYRFHAVRRFAEPLPLVLVRRGRIVARNLRREYVTVPELMASLREQGIDKLADVKMARMEPDGAISIIRRPRVGG
ncbi:MAG: YetF domain-containing protein [Pseudomonadota bacterium]